MSVTLRDVAYEAGVSIGTASQALNNNPKVTAETRQKVIEAAYTVGYAIRKHIPNVLPVDRAISTIGILAKHDEDDIMFTNPFYSHIYAGAEAACRERGIRLFFSGINVDGENHPVDWPSLISDEDIDGLLLVGTTLQKPDEKITDKIQVPVILIDSYAPGFEFDSIVTDNVEGAHKAIAHLVELGHQEIGLIGWHQHSPPSIQERKQGYQVAMRMHGLDAESFIEESPLRRAGGMEAFGRLRKRKPEVTAVFACNDETATGVLREALDLGLRIPQDLSIVGFDNVYLSEGVTPALTTIHVHKNWMGVLGVQFLLERVAFPGKPKSTTYVETELVVRQSTAAPNRRRN